MNRHPDHAPLRDLARVMLGDLFDAANVAAPGGITQTPDSGCGLGFPECGLARAAPESRRERTKKHGTIPFPESLVAPWIRAGRAAICERGLRANRKETGPRCKARTT